jgi:hypothetical protein
MGSVTRRVRQGDWNWLGRIVELQVITVAVWGITGLGKRYRLPNLTLGDEEFPFLFFKASRQNSDEL